MKNAIFEPERKNDRYSTAYTYDQAGNIITLTRRGMTTPPGSNDPQYGLIDNLLYEYDISNPGVKRLTSVDDLLQGPTQAYGFEPDIMQTGYDNNGNMLSNENGSVEWSVINMPFSATLSDGTMKFDYTYTGEKIKVERTGPDGEQRLYLAGAEYVFDTETSTWVLDNYQFEEGRKQYITDEYPQDPKPAVIQYQITDHLGNLAVLFSDANGDGHISSETEAVENGEDPEIIQRMYYYPFGLPMQGNWTNTTEYQDRYTYNHKEQVTGLEWFAYGARYYDAKIGRFAGVDPLAEKYPSISSYAYVANNPINMIDPDGRYIVPAAFAQKYKMITSYLQKHVANDVMNSPTILNAFASNTAADSPDGVGNLSVDKVRETVTWGSGPSIIAKDNPGDMSGANGFYDSTTGEIQLSTARLDHLEAVLSSDASDEDKFKALLPVYMTLLHETVHYGDYLDGLRQDGGEPGNEFESDVWMSKRVEADGETFDVFYFFGDKYNPNDVQEIIDEKKDQNVFPTVPKNE